MKLKKLVPQNFPITSDPNAYVGLLGEITVDIDDQTISFHDGSTPGGILIGGGGGGVSTFNTRTGAVTLTSGDVTTALGFAPVQTFNTRTGAVTLSSGDVTTALGYTPASGLTSGVIASLVGANMNSTSDQPFIMTAGSNFVVEYFLITNASGSLTTAVGGVYTAASKGGTKLLDNTQVYSVLSTTSKFMLAANGSTNDVGISNLFNNLNGTPTAGTLSTALYLSLTTPQGSTMTADFYAIGFAF